MGACEQGVLVRKVEPTSPAFNVIQEVCLNTFVKLQREVYFEVHKFFLLNIPKVKIGQSLCYLKPLFIFGQGDVLLSFDDIPVANEGTVPFRAGERISFGFLVSQKYVFLH